MPKRSCCLAALFLTLSWSAHCRAREAERRLGDAGGVSLGVERLAGLSFSTEHADGTRLDSHAFALFGAPNTMLAHHATRFAADFFPLSGFGVGGAFGLTRTGAEIHYDSGDGGPTPEQTSVIVVGRVGYAFGSDDGFYVWPRAALGYETARLSGDGLDLREDIVTATLEAALVSVPTRYLSVSLVPALDVDVSRRQTSPFSTTQPPKVTTFGFYAGVGTYF